MTATAATKKNCFTWAVLIILIIKFTICPTSNWWLQASKENEFVGFGGSTWFINGNVIWTLNSGTHGTHKRTMETWIAYSSHHINRTTLLFALSVYLIFNCLFCSWFIVHTFTSAKKTELVHVWRLFIIICGNAVVDAHRLHFAFLSAQFVVDDKSHVIFTFLMASLIARQQQLFKRTQIKWNN